MIVSTASHVKYRTQQFFAYFLARQEVARRDDIPLPDRLVILSASLDALAKHWWDTSASRRGTKPAMERMRTF